MLNDPGAEEPDDVVIRELFARRRKRQRIAAAIAVVAIFGAFFGAELTNDPDERPYQTPLGIAGIAVVVAVILFSFRNWRCPRCNRYLGKRMSTRFCASCGAQLTE